MLNKSYILLYIYRKKSLIYNNYILENDFFNKNFIVNDNKYYFTDTNYHNIDYFLYFYYKICYYLKKFALVRKKLII